MPKRKVQKNVRASLKPEISKAHYLVSCGLHNHQTQLGKKSS